MVASAARAQVDLEALSRTGDLDVTVPVGLDHLLMPPKYWYPIFHCGYWPSYVGKSGRLGQVQMRFLAGVLVFPLEILRFTDLAAASSGGLIAI